MKAYTDYPMQESEHGKLAPIREVKIIGYDGNKYATVTRPEFGEMEIKIGYLYREPGRVGEIPSLKHADLVNLCPARSDDD